MNRVIEPTNRDHYKQVHENYHGDPALKPISIAFMWLDSVEQDYWISSRTKFERAPHAQEQIWSLQGTPH